MKSTETLERRLPTVPSADDSVDLDQLARDLGREIRGEVGFDAGTRALYATDGSNYRRVPLGVVFPRDTEDVVRAVEISRKHGVPVVPRGGGTGLTGGCCNVAVVLEFSKHMNTITSLEPEERRAQVQPGVILDHLRAAAEEHGLTFGPDPSTHAYCNLGGMIGNNSCGVHSIMAGKTVDNVHELEVLTYDGLRLVVGPTDESELSRIIAEGGRRGGIYAGLRDIRDRYTSLIRERFPDIPRRVSGYNLDQLLPENGFHVARALVGTEGTCVTVLDATARLVPSPAARVLLVLGYHDPFAAADHVPEVLDARPIGLEGFDERLAEYMRKKDLNVSNLELLPNGRGWLLAEFGGATVEEATDAARRLQAELEQKPHTPACRLIEDPVAQRQVWTIRESGLGAVAFVPGEPDAWEGWEDAAVPPDRLGSYLRQFHALLERFGYEAVLYGHFGDGCVHTRIDFDLTTTQGIRQYRAFVEEAADLVLQHGGSLSGEHGDGYSRSELLPRMFGPELMQAFAEFKGLWDPHNRMNPGKIVDPAPLDANLRLGADYRPPELPTHFTFPHDEGSFHRAALRCVGVGKCRREDAGTMCPSYRVLRDEKHTTRGRAHLLFEMLKGDPVGGGWRDDNVKESLDLCLSCKGCKGECPVQVDVATYKAEFFSHYYHRRLRPRTAYAFGLIYWWARLASRVPRLVNAVASAPGTRNLAKWAAGIAPQRTIPRFANRTFTAWFNERQRSAAAEGPKRAAASPPTGAADSAAHGDGDDTSRSTSSKRVLLWPDTFTNHFHPNIPIAAAEVLEAAGFEVALPQRSLCCGRPLYDFGMLDLAKRMLRQTMNALRAEIAAGTPIVVLEPSCLSVFRDELLNLFPDDDLANKLAAQSFLFAEFFDRYVDDDRLPQLSGAAILHGHCHQKSLFGMDADQKLLARVGIRGELLDSGCCGMAGPFGFEKEKYDVSVAAGERVLLPAARDADREVRLIADGFSCREQIAQGTGRHALHLAEVIRSGF